VNINIDTRIQNPLAVFVNKKAPDPRSKTSISEQFFGFCKFSARRKPRTAILRPAVFPPFKICSARGIIIELVNFVDGIFFDIFIEIVFFLVVIMIVANIVRA
jgi:hypothetical protein